MENNTQKVESSTEFLQKIAHHQELLNEQTKKIIFAMLDTTAHLETLKANIKYGDISSIQHNLEFFIDSFNQVITQISCFDILQNKSIAELKGAEQPEKASEFISRTMHLLKNRLKEIKNYERN